MASKHPLKTTLWIDASQVRRVLMNELFKSAGLEAFFFANPKELSSEVLESLGPTLMIIHSDFEDFLNSELLEIYKDSIVVLGGEIEPYKFLELPVQPLTIIDDLVELI